VTPDLLPTLNAILNATAGLCLLAGYYFIRRKDVENHRRAMLSAFWISVMFLISYLIHHARVGSVPYQGTGTMRIIYFAILIPHVILAASVVPLAIVTLRRGLRRDIERHRPLARVTLPIWLFVSATGVVVYMMLYGG
jgi:putative membrane protein